MHAGGRRWSCRNPGDRTEKTQFWQQRERTLRGHSCVLSHRMEQEAWLLWSTSLAVPESGVLGRAAGAHIGRRASIETSEDRPSTGPEECAVEALFKWPPTVRGVIRGLGVASVVGGEGMCGLPHPQSHSIDKGSFLCCYT